MQISADGNTLTIHLENVPVVDALTFPPPLPSNIAPDEVDISPYQLIRARASFDIAYKKASNSPRHIQPATDDPLSPLNWAGNMWDATNSGSFSVAYADGTFSASGTFDSSGNFGEMGTERNGFFVNHPEQADDASSVESPGHLLSLPLNTTQIGQTAATAVTKQPVKTVLLKGRVPVKVTH